MRYGFIYETTNLINGMKYIGRHKRSGSFIDPDDSEYLGSGNHLLHALEKYGRQNFTRKIIEECNNEEELNEREVYYLSLYDCANNPMYYNMTNTAYTGWPILEGENNPFYSKSHKEETKEVMSKKAKLRKGVLNSHYGKVQTERNRDAVRISNRRRRGEVHITNGSSNKCILPSEIPEYIALGWKRGRTYKLLCAKCMNSFLGDNPRRKYCERCRDENTL